MLKLLKKIWYTKYMNLPFIRFQRTPLSLVSRSTIEIFFWDWSSELLNNRLLVSDLTIRSNQKMYRNQPRAYLMNHHNLSILRLHYYQQCEPNLRISLIGFKKNLVTKCKRLARWSKLLSRNSSLKLRLTSKTWPREFYLKLSQWLNLQD